MGPHHTACQSKYPFSLQAAKINATLAYERQMLGKQSLEVAERDVETARAALRGLEAEQEAAQEATHQAQAALQEQVRTAAQGIWFPLAARQIRWGSARPSVFPGLTSIDFLFQKPDKAGLWALSRKLPKKPHTRLKLPSKNSCGFSPSELAFQPCSAVQGVWKLSRQLPRKLHTRLKLPCRSMCLHYECLLLSPGC